MDLKYSNEKIPEEVFLKEHREVLSIWPTGKEVDLDEAVEYHKKLPPEKRMPVVFRKAKASRTVLVSPRIGAPLLQDMISGLNYLEDEGKVDVLSIFSDTYTRRNQFEKAENALRECEKMGRPSLNGYPISHYGVKGCREIVNAIRHPIRSVSVSSDQRFTNEIALAGGCTQVAGGPFAYTLLFGQNTTLGKNVAIQQYSSRLVGWYEDHGVPVTMMHSGTNTGSLVYPAMAITLGIVETLISAQQGCRSVLLGARPNLSPAQDVAMSRLFQTLTDEYLRRSGFPEVDVFQYCNQWAGSYPRDQSQAFATVCLGAVAAAYSDAVMTAVKTYDEGIGTPTKEVSAACCRATKQIINILKNQHFSGPEVEEEMEIISLEVHALMDNILEMGDGNVFQGALNAFKAGRLEFTYAPHKDNAGRVLLVRDAAGAVRLLDPGYLPLPERALKHHRKKIAEREKIENEKAGYDTVVDSIMFIEKPL